MKIAVFWDAVVYYGQYKPTFQSTHHTDNGNSKFLWNVG
jgi:hypothetical protein